MLSVTSLHQSFILNKCTTISSAFNKLRFNDAHYLLNLGLHPKYLPKSWYEQMVELMPEKLYLFKPHHVKYIDLISVISNLNNLELYQKHINYYKDKLIKTCDYNLLIKCINYMILTDDYIRYLYSKFSEDDAIELLSLINSHSIQNISYMFTDSLAEKILLRDCNMYTSLYEHQTFSSDFLKDMLYKYGITPINIGILNDLTDNVAVDILSSVKKPIEAVCILDMLSDDCLNSNYLQQFVLENIVQGKNIEHYRAYVSDYLPHYVNDMGVYANLFFDNIISVEEFTLTRKDLEVICKHIDCYMNDIVYLVKYMIKLSYIDLLANIVDKIPRHLLTEELCIHIVCDSPKHVCVKHLLHTSLVMRMCSQMGYVDMIDFLATISLDTLIDNKIDIITEYSFTTNWYNTNNDLLILLLTKYGFCPYIMNKILFHYPLSKIMSKNLLQLMVENENSKLFFPKMMSTLPYLLCTTHKLKQKKIDDYKTKLETKPLQECYECVTFNSNKSTELKILLKIHKTELYTCILNDLCNVKGYGSSCIQFKRPKLIITDESRVCMQLLDICTLASKGLFFNPSMYLSSWVPVLDLLKGIKVTAPDRININKIDALSPLNFVDYNQLGCVITRDCSLKESISNYHAAINVLMNVMFIYLVVGCKKYVDQEKTKVYIELLLSAFFRGLKIKYVLNDSISDVCCELDNLRIISCDSDFISIKNIPLVSTLSLCEKVCIAVILDNNQSFKSS
ncbi:hypothetical protein [Cetacean poxvirus 1]|nr:hypothetical protein [Cetacean poxvirus 1]